MHAISVPASASPTTADAPRDWTVDLADPRAAVARAAAVDLVREVERIVRGRRARVGLSPTDVQDAIGETLLEVAKRVDAGHPVPGAVVQRIAAAVCSRFVNGPVRHETAKALRLLKERIAAEEARIGATLSSRAIERLAEEVRLGPDFSPRHRPVERFHLVEGLSKPSSLDQIGVEQVELVRDRTGGDASGYPGAGGACDRLLDDLELGRCTRAEARRALWGAFAADEGLPSPVAGCVPPELAELLREHRAVDPEGVAAAARAHLEGRRTRATAALFAPFGNCGPAAQEAIARALVARGPIANELWAGALAVAAAPADDVVPFAAPPVRSAGHTAGFAGPIR